MAMIVEVCMQDNHIECVQSGRLPSEVFATISLSARGEFLCYCFRHCINLQSYCKQHPVHYVLVLMFQFLMSVIKLG